MQRALACIISVLSSFFFGMADRVCRLCKAVHKVHRTVSLFSKSGIRQKWASRICALLEVPVDIQDGLPEHICDNCRNRVVSLEKAAADLAAFKHLARSSYDNRGVLKRTKNTSDEVGVSPDTVRERPRPKAARKRLHFGSK